MSSSRARQQHEVAEFLVSGAFIALMLAALWLFQGCASGVPKHASCDEAKVAAFTLRCAAQVKLLCDPDPAKPCEVEMLCEEELCEICPLSDGCEK